MIAKDFTQKRSVVIEKLDNLELRTVGNSPVPPEPYNWRRAYCNFFEGAVCFVTGMFIGKAIRDEITGR